MLIKRVLAYLIDCALVVSFLVLCSFWWATPSPDGSTSIKGPIGLIPLTVLFLYFPLLEYFYGKTVGKKLLRLKVVSVNGEKLKFTTCLVRHWFDVIDGLSTFGLVAIITMRNTDKGQRLADLSCKTVVIAAV